MSPFCSQITKACTLQYGCVSTAALVTVIPAHYTHTHSRECGHCRLTNGWYFFFHSKQNIHCFQISPPFHGWFQQNIFGDCISLGQCQVFQILLLSLCSPKMVSKYVRPAYYIFVSARKKVPPIRMVSSRSSHLWCGSATQSASWPWEFWEMNGPIKYFKQIWKHSTLQLLTLPLTQKKCSGPWAWQFYPHVEEPIHGNLFNLVSSLCSAQLQPLTGACGNHWGP